MDSINGDTVNLLLETFRECARRGDQACLFLETRNGKQFGTLSVRIPDDRLFGTTSTLGSARKKSPSFMRRDQHRLREFLQRKASQDAPGSPSANSTPTISLASTSQDAKTPEMVKMDKPANENASGDSTLDQAKTDEATSEVKNNESDDKTSNNKEENSWGKENF